jgi:hypothetical protein
MRPRRLLSVRRSTAYAQKHICETTAQIAMVTSSGRETANRSNFLAGFVDKVLEYLSDKHM